MVLVTTLLHILKEKKIKGIGIEPSIINSNISKKLGHNVINDYLKENTFRAKSFKLVVSLYTFTYINDLAEKFKIFRKILINNGYLLIRVHQYKFSKTYHQKNHFKKLKNAKHTFNHFSENSLKTYLIFIILIFLCLIKILKALLLLQEKLKKRNTKKLEI